MKRILVTGGAGFIGSHAVDAFIQDGYEVLVIDDLSSGSDANLNPKARFECTSIDSARAAETLRAFRPEAIFHYAAQIDVRKSAADPVLDAQLNIINSLRLLELGLNNGLAYFAFASSGGAIYGEPQSGPQDETHPERPCSPYGVAKLSIDKYLASFHHYRGLKSCSMRFSNVYGPRQNGKGEAGVVALMIGQGLKGQPLRVNGKGEQTRDFVYVKDLARAARLILRHQPQGVLNLGTGIETSIAQLAHILQERFAVPPGISHAPAIHGEQFRSVLDSTLAKKVIDWEPVTRLGHGLQETTDWFSSLAPAAPRPQKHIRVSQ
ncbi:NAD-dependent epimerase/dehydratase family protein [Mesoterricola silvestris]|uniref:UDP-glucose 4-epimerase n=1 Tax=Mesoterricola silvestris TaxID=2927979 RepID=A0AA48K6R3_9BACT|nr:NAD-dependent epimerase/dehydratase family protein [Mesoterricola silvestris]BDU71089.1 UDP-glucose 4-epimerase [Mesoterricola silvestris]